MTGSSDKFSNRLFAAPNGAHIRRACHLCEWLTERELPAQTLPAGGYVDLFPAGDYLTAEQLMFLPEGAVRVHVSGRPVDMRKSFDRLYVFTRHGLGCDPLPSELCVFINRRGT